MEILQILFSESALSSRDTKFVIRIWQYSKHAFTVVYIKILFLYYWFLIEYFITIIY